jgi:hypothetical protein
MTIVTATIIGFALVIAGALFGGRFTPVAVPNSGGAGYVLILYRFTGSARFCVPSGCRDVGELH